MSFIRRSELQWLVWAIAGVLTVVGALLFWEDVAFLGIDIFHVVGLFAACMWFYVLRQLRREQAVNADLRRQVNDFHASRAGRFRAFLLESAEQLDDWDSLPPLVRIATIGQWTMFMAGRIEVATGTSQEFMSTVSVAGFPTAPTGTMLDDHGKTVVNRVDVNRQTVVEYIRHLADVTVDSDIHASYDPAVRFIGDGGGRQIAMQVFTQAVVSTVGEHLARITVGGSKSTTWCSFTGWATHTRHRLGQLFDSDRLAWLAEAEDVSQDLSDDDWWQLQRAWGRQLDLMYNSVGDMFSPSEDHVSEYSACVAAVPSSKSLP